MASSINASTAGAGGVITTADNSGVLNLQSGGTTVATVQSTGFSLPTASTINAANTFGFKNRIINGGMTIDQRNAGASVTLTNSSTYLLDRYFVNRIGGAATFACQQSTTVPAGFKNSFAITVGTGAVPSGSDEGCLGQCIEGLNVSDLDFGTANAKTFTLSFWVRSSVIGTYGVTFFNSAFNRSYVTSYTISVANTWEQKTITVAGDTSGTWLTTNGRGICVSWDLGTGSTYSAAASSSWQAGGYEGLTGGTKLASTAGATWYITGVQLEVGSQATSFDFRSHGTELALCQRYFEKSYNLETAVGTATSTGTYYPIVAGNTGTSNFGATFRYCVNKRTAATFTSWDTGGNAGKCGTDGQGLNQTLNSAGGGQSTSPVLYVSGLNNPTALSFQWSASAEL